MSDDILTEHEPANHTDHSNHDHIDHADHHDDHGDHAANHKHHGEHQDHTDHADHKRGRAEARVADIEEAMQDVVDPELGINVVDLGLLYGVHVDDDNVATLDMTLTSAGCPLTDVIEDQARMALMGGPEGGLVNDVRINWVWLPPWGPDKITDEGREQLRALGFNV